jgi:hypothetical protein
MIEPEEFEIIYEGNVREFEEQLLYKSEQEMRKGRPGLWCKIADIYARQRSYVSIRFLMKNLMI